MICNTCEKDLGGHSRYCPENPVKASTKWDECVCYVHTCYDAKARRRPPAPVDSPMDGGERR